MAATTAGVPAGSAAAAPPVPGGSAAAPPAPASASNKPVQIVRISDDGASFTLVESALAEVLDKVPRGMKVSVVSIVGAFRTGKSFLLDLLLRYLSSPEGSKAASALPVCDGSSSWLQKEGVVEGQAAQGEQSSESTGGFSWRSGRERCTTGIWLWSEPFLRELPSTSGASQRGETVAVLLMDTQGMFDSETSQMLTASIFGLSTLFSSMLVYNVSSQVREDHLQLLSLFSEYGRLAYFQGNDAEEQHAPFQHLQFLVRDATAQDVSWRDATLPVEALRRDNVRLLDSALRQRSLEDLAATREQIHTCFEQLTAFQLPHPGHDVSEGTFGGSLAEVRPAFLRAMELYVHELFTERLAPKKVNGAPVTARQLKSLMVQYCAIFADGRTPEPQSMLSATAQGTNTAAVEEGQLDYEEAMDEALQSGEYVDDKVLAAHHRAAEEAALQRFDSMANFGPQAAKAAAKDRLKGFISRQWALTAELNDARNPWKNFEVYALALSIVVGAFMVRQLLELTCSSWSSVCHRSSAFLAFLYTTVLALSVVMAVVTGQPAVQRARSMLMPLLSTGQAAVAALVEANHVNQPSVAPLRRNGSDRALRRQGSNLRKRRGVQE